MASGFLSSLYISLRANTADFETDMGRAARVANQRAKAIKQGVSGALKDLWGPVLAGFSVAALTSGVKQVTDRLLEMKAAAHSVAMPLTQFSALAGVAKDADVNMQDLSTGLSTMARNLSLAQQGSKQAQGAFQALGLDPSKLKDSHTAFLAVADALSKYKDGVAKTAIEQQIFSRSGAQFNELLNQGSAAIQQQEQHMRDLGVALDEDGVKKLQAFDDQSDELSDTLQGIGQRITIALLPALTSVNKNLTDFAQHGDVTDFASGLGTVMTTLGRAGMVVAATFSEVGRVIGGTFAIVRTAFQGINPLLLSNPLTAGPAMAAGFAKNAKEVAATAREVGSDLASNFKDWMARITQFGNDATAAASKAAAATGGGKDLKLVDPNAAANAAKAASAAQALRAAYLGLATAAQQAQQATATPLEQAADAHAKTLQGILKLVDQYVQKGGQLAQVQGLVDSAVAGANRRYQEQVAAIKAQQNAFQQALDQQVAAQRNAIDIQVQSIGMGDKEASRLQQVNQLEQQRLQRVQALQLAQTTHPEQYAELAKQITATNAAYGDMRDTMIDGFKRMDSAQSQWSNGFDSALANFADQAGNVAGQTESMFTDMFGGISDSLTTFVMTGKLSFKDLANSIISDIVRMETRILVSKALSMIMGMFTGVSAGGTISDSLYSSSGTVAIGFGTASAKGNVFAGPGIAAYENKIVNRPTYFAAGGNVMGERGPEAIMPLTRSSDGSLGVRASGVGAAAAPLQVEINITNKSGDAVQGRQTGQRQDGKKMIIDMVLDAVADNVSSGGKVAKSMQGRFGLQRRGVSVGA